MTPVVTIEGLTDKEIETFAVRNDKVSRKVVLFYDQVVLRHRRSQYDPLSGEIILDSLHFDNNVKGFTSLLSHLSKLNKSKEVIVGFESTGHYHQALFNYLTISKYKCRLINPYMTNKFRSISL